MPEKLQQPTHATLQELLERKSSISDLEKRELAMVALQSCLRQFQDEDNPTIIRGFGD